MINKIETRDWSTIVKNLKKNLYKYNEDKRYFEKNSIGKNYRICIYKNVVRRYWYSTEKPNLKKMPLNISERWAILKMENVRIFECSYNKKCVNHCKVCITNIAIKKEKEKYAKYIA